MNMIYFLVILFDCGAMLFSVADDNYTGSGMGGSERLIKVFGRLQALMLVINSLPNLLTAWYSALYCPSTHSDINANVIENRIKHFMRAHELMLSNISIGSALV